MKKKVIKNQQYEQYWKITLEYSDYYGERFNTVLSMIVEYIDKYVDINSGIEPHQYEELQSLIESVYPKSDSASTRKSINQFLKLGFINNKAKGYHYLTKSFLVETDVEQKRLLFSKIVYENASFSRSVSNESNVNEIKFLVKTLEACGQITKEQLMAVIFTDVLSVEKGYLTRSELLSKLAEITVDRTFERKYNQRNYLFNICGSLTDIYTKGDVMSLNPDILIDKKEKAKVRDPYLQRLYKIELINEFIKKYKTSSGKCVLEKLAYPILIASHIKPYAVCEESEQFDKNNGLLLSKNMDMLFDNGYITFDDNGNIVASSRLDPDVAEYVSGFSLDSKIYTVQRKMYMEYHREHVFVA